MEVGQNHDGMHHFGQSPAVFALGQCLDVLGGQQPGSVGQDFVDFADRKQLLRNVIQSVQPAWIAASFQEFPLV